MSLAINRFKNRYREQLFNFCLLLLRFFLKISLLEMLIAFGNEHLNSYQVIKRYLPIKRCLVIKAK